MFLNKAVLIYLSEILAHFPFLCLHFSFLEVFMIAIKQSYLLLKQIIHGSHIVQWNKGKTTSFRRLQSAAYRELYCTKRVKLLKRVKMGHGIISLFLMCVI